MTKTRFRTHYDPKPPKLVPNTGESMTQPDMSLTVRQIMQNHTRGHGLGVSQREGIYSESEIPVFDDLTDMQTHLDHLKEQEEILTREIAQEKKKAQEKAKAEKEASKAEKNEDDSPLSDKAKKSLKEPEKEK